MNLTQINCDRNQDFFGQHYWLVFSIPNRYNQLDVHYQPMTCNFCVIPVSCCVWLSLQLILVHFCVMLYHEFQLLLSISQKKLNVFNQQETMCDMSSCTIANDRQFLDSVDTLSFWILSCQKNDRGCKLNFRFNFCATGLVTHEKIALQFQMFAVWNCGLKWRGSYHKWAASCETQYVL